MAKGNRQATGKKAKRGPELVSRIRQQIIAAMDLVDAGEKTVAELLADQARENPLKFLELVSKYVPRDVNLGGEDGGALRVVIEREYIDPADKASATEETRVLN